MTQTFRTVWDSIPLPTVIGNSNQDEILGTNARVFKDSDGSLGLLISDLKTRPDVPKFENLEIDYRHEKILNVPGSPSRNLRNCIEVRLDPSCDSDLLASILGRMHEIEPSGGFSGELLFEVIEEVVEIVRKPPRPPSKEEVIGAWGEMYLLHRFVSDSESADDKIKVLSCWESDGAARDIIDFRFPYASGGTSIEVKTSISERTHHINGISQVTVPDGYSNGLLGSLLITETDGSSGKTACELLADLRALIPDSHERFDDFQGTLGSKVSIRGPECLDERYFFSAREGALRLIPETSVPKPTIGTGVTEVEWVADVSGCLEVDAVDAESLLSSISSP